MQRLKKETNVFINYRVAGFLEDFTPSSCYADTYPILGGFDDMEKVVAETGIQEQSSTGTSAEPAEPPSLSGADTGSLC